jgi:dTDP-glucose pyrophosphorylase
MIRQLESHLIFTKSSVKEALIKLDELSLDAVLFILDEDSTLQGSLTDGDIRRGLIKGLDMQSHLMEFANLNPKRIEKHRYDIHEIIAYREKHYDILPIVDADNRVINVLNLREQHSYLPVDAIIMAGGKGARLRPLTEKTPKPLLIVGDKPILEHGIERLRHYGVDDVWISLHYLGEQIESYFGDGSQRNMRIQYVWEQNPLGTIGAVRLIDNFQHDYILVTNSDLLTTLDYEDFFLDFLDKEADMAVATIPYEVKIPYAVMETSNQNVISFKEKPTYTFYSNAGIYLMKRTIVDLIPEHQLYDSTNLMQALINEGMKLVSYPMRQYWLDIGKPEDFKKAQEDIKHIQL